MKKTTQQLLDMMENSSDYGKYRESNQTEMSRTFMNVNRAFIALLEEKEMKKSAVIARSGIEVHYAYQIFSGTKVPSRDKVIMLCVGFGLTKEETQRLLKITGYPQLYGRNERDNAILFGLTKGMSMIEINYLLYDLNLEILM